MAERDGSWPFLNCENSIGVIVGTPNKDPNDPKWHDDAGVRAYRAFFEKYLSGADICRAPTSRRRPSRSGILCFRPRCPASRSTPARPATWCGPRCSCNAGMARAGISSATSSTRRRSEARKWCEVQAVPVILRCERSEPRRINGPRLSSRRPLRGLLRMTGKP
jgi:hypothetical protein